MECYKVHGNDENGACAEGFFRDRTAQSLELEVKERMNDTKQSIQRIYDQQHTQAEDAVQETFSQEVLLDMMRCLEEGNESVVRQLLESEKVRRALSQSVENGELQDYLLDNWTPWWRPEILQDQSEFPIEAPNKQLTFDERLLQVQPLSRLHTNISKLPNLRYNLVDILYAVAWTLRLYHGAQNAIDTGVDSGETLLEASGVLSQDARWDSLAEVLSACTALSTRSMRSRCNTLWSCLVEDVALICENRRFIAKALLEASDILRAASLAAKQAEDKEAAGKFRRTRKKIEFFLSWCREESVAKSLDELSKRIEAWGADWKLPDKEDDELQMIRLSSPERSKR